MPGIDDRTGLLALALDPAGPSEPRPLAADEYAGLTARHGRILRAALAMRGGVSLAVWTAGAVAEIDLWRRIRIRRSPDGSTVAVLIPPSPVSAASDDSWLRRAGQYARMLHSRGFDSVEFDVMAGASGGGLNAVMYAVAQRAGASVDSLLDTWRNVGSAWRLMHPPGFARLDSVLRGDGYFWVEVRRALREFHDPAVSRIHHTHRAVRITVDLSATIIDKDDPVDALGAGLVVTLSRRSGAWERLVTLLSSSATPDSRVLAQVLDLRRRTARQCAVYAVGSLATLLAAGWALWAGGLSVSSWILAAAAGLLAARAGLRARSPEEGSTPGPVYSAGTIGYAAWVVLIVWVPGWIESFHPDPGTILPLTIAAAGFLLAAVLTIGWLPIIPDLPRTWLINWLTVSLVAAAASGMLAWVATRLRGTGFGVLDTGTAVALVVLVWGSLVWWIPEIPEGTGARWRSYAVPDDLRRTYPVSPGADLSPGPAPTRPSRQREAPVRRRRSART